MRLPKPRFPRRGSTYYLSFRKTGSHKCVYSASTHGCLRLQPEAIAEIYPVVDEGMPVEIAYAVSGTLPEWFPKDEPVQ
jgi:hypothetical protein